MGFAKKLMIDLNKYRNIIFDFDGVILDTNTLKENNIEKTIKKYLSPQKSKSCLQYLIQIQVFPEKSN